MPDDHEPALRQDTTRAQLDPAVSDQFVPLRRQLGVSSFGINQIALAPGQRGRIHRHNRQEEVYLVLEGTLTLAIEGEQSDLGEGELIRVAPEVRRQLINRGPGRLVLLALGGDGEHLGRDGEAFVAWEDTTGAPPQEIPRPGDLDPAELRAPSPSTPAAADDAVARYLAASEANDVEALLATLAPDCELVSPISGRMAFRGERDLRVLATAVYGGLHGLRWGPQIGEGRVRTVIGEAQVGPGVRLTDAMVFELDAQGRIARVRPHIRPWLGLTMFALTLGPRMALHPGAVLRAVRGGSR
ncbi:MAG TPA: cupin domain-containing protein [Solirubrobacteraceae bacterium]|nr:cupin domain-containing protein [Solirubrobacteraceae bacterium]